MMRSLHHPRIATIMDVISTRKHIYIVMERGGRPLQELVDNFEERWLLCRCYLATPFLVCSLGRSCCREGKTIPHNRLLHMLEQV